MVRKFPGKSSRKFGNCWISEKRTIQPKIPEIFWNYANLQFFLFKASSLGHDHGEVNISRKDDVDEYSKMDQYFSLESCHLSVGTINTSRWCICLFCIGWLRNVQRFITRAEPLYESLNPLSSDVFPAVVQFPKSEPFNRKFRKFRDENQMERKLPGKKIRKFGRTSGGCPLLRKLCKFVIFYSALVLWQRSSRVGQLR